MNKVVAATIVLTALSINAVQGATHTKLTPEERRAKIYARTGGVIQRPISGKAFKLVNAAGLPSNILTQVSESLQSGLFFPMVVTDKAMTPKQALDEKTGFALIYVKDDGPRILLSPEDGWAKINVSSIDSTDAKVLWERILKESWRATVYALGGGNTYVPQCVMKPIASLADLDATTPLIACPQVFPNVTEMAGKLGIKAHRPTTYLMACREGWAPAPTNAVQKAIWDKVHQLPTAPIKIKPETKPVKD